MRRILLLVILLCSFLFAANGAVQSQEATPASALSTLGLPELVVNVSDTVFEGIPDQLEAGRYLVTVNASPETEFGGGVAFVQPVGVTVDEFLGAMAGPPDGPGSAESGGTPMAEPAASPVDGGEESGGPPDLIYDAIYAGGTFANAGQSAQVVLDLPPGDWIAWADDPEAPQQPVHFTVMGEMPADLPEPQSGATIIMGEYLFKVSEGALTSGPQVIELQNIGAQPHFMAFLRGPDGMTKQQIQVVLDEEMAAEMSGTPVAYSDLNPDEDFAEDDGSFTPTQSMGTSIWFAIDLAPGSYVMACFFPDREDGMPHAYHGMFEVVEITQ